jgi:hypothetical protein
VGTVKTEQELDALPKGTRLRFTVSGATLYKTIADMWVVEGVKGCWGSDEICANRTPMEIISWN